MATIFGTEIGLPQSSLIAAILMVQFVGVPFAFLFGSLATRIGTKRAILLGLVVYLFISCFGYFVTTTPQFFVMAFLVATYDCPNACVRRVCARSRRHYLRGDRSWHTGNQVCG